MLSAEKRCCRTKTGCFWLIKLVKEARQGSFRRSPTTWYRPGYPVFYSDSRLINSKITLDREDSGQDGTVTNNYQQTQTLPQL
eukprot:11606376-Ditylum_brightwellii.AAC.1